MEAQAAKVADEVPAVPVRSCCEAREEILRKRPRPSVSSGLSAVGDLLTCVSLLCS